jgi:hypothetical protein
MSEMQFSYIWHLVHAYSLCDIIHYHSAVGISVVHGRQGLVSLLARGVPYLELHGRGVVKGDGLC